MKLTPEQRRKIIDRLIENDMNYNADDSDFLKEILENGFVGYGTLNDEQLIATAEEVSIEVPSE